MKVPGSESLNQVRIDVRGEMERNVIDDAIHISMPVFKPERQDILNVQYSLTQINSQIINSY